MAIKAILSGLSTCLLLLFSYIQAIPADISEFDFRTIKLGSSSQEVLKIFPGEHRENENFRGPVLDEKHKRQPKKGFGVNPLEYHKRDDIVFVDQANKGEECTFSFTEEPFGQGLYLLHCSYRGDDQVQAYEFLKKFSLDLETKYGSPTVDASYEEQTRKILRYCWGDTCPEMLKEYETYKFYWAQYVPSLIKRYAEKYSGQSGAKTYVVSASAITKKDVGGWYTSFFLLDTEPIFKGQKEFWEKTIRLRDKGPDIKF